MTWLLTAIICLGAGVVGVFVGVILTMLWLTMPPADYGTFDGEC